MLEKQLGVYLERMLRLVHYHQVIFNVKRFKTGQIDDYPANFDYYVLREGE